MQSHFLILSEYLEYLVSVNTKINKFISVSEDELLSVLGKTTLEEDPFFILHGYEGKLDGNNQRTIGTRSVSFSIVSRVKDQNNYSDIYQKMNENEDIGLQFLSRIQYDSLDGSVTWLKNAFRKESVRFSTVIYETANGLFGCAFHFDVEVGNPLKAMSEFWTDKNFC